MYDTVNLLLQICLFKKGPQDIPASTGVFQSLILAYAIVAFLNLSMSTDELDALFQLSVEIILVLVFAKLILLLTRKSERFIQTASALLGTDALISFFAMPGIASITANQMTLLAFVTIVLLMCWHWLVTAHIIRHAISQPFLFALGISFLYVVATYQIMALLFPGVAES